MSTHTLPVIAQLSGIPHATLYDAVIAFDVQPVAVIGGVNRYDYAEVVRADGRMKVRAATRRRRDLRAMLDTTG